MPRVTSLPHLLSSASSSAYLALTTASTFQLPPGPTLVPGPCSATRDIFNTSTSSGRLSSPVRSNDGRADFPALARPGRHTRQAWYKSGIVALQSRCRIIGTGESGVRNLANAEYQKGGLHL
jgi:hypothetical protein